MPAVPISQAAVIVGAVGSYAMTLIVSYGLMKQAEEIFAHPEKRAETVSAPMYILFVCAASIQLLYSGQIGDSALVFNGVVRGTMYVPILVGIKRFRGFTSRETGLGLVGLTLVAITFAFPIKELMYTLIWSGMCFVILHQALEMRRAKSIGRVRGVTLYTIWISTFFWFVYGFAAGLRPLELTTPPSLLSISIVVAAYWYYLRRRGTAMGSESFEAACPNLARVVKGDMGRVSLTYPEPEIARRIDEMIRCPGKNHRMWSPRISDEEFILIHVPGEAGAELRRMMSEKNCSRLLAGFQQLLRENSHFIAR